MTAGWRGRRLLLPRRFPTGKAATAAAGDCGRHPVGQGGGPQYSTPRTGCGQPESGPPADRRKCRQISAASGVITPQDHQPGPGVFHRPGQRSGIEPTWWSAPSFSENSTLAASSLHVWPRSVEHVGPSLCRRAERFGNLPPRAQTHTIGSTAVVGFGLAPPGVQKPSTTTTRFRLPASTTTHLARSTAAPNGQSNYYLRASGRLVRWLRP